MKEEKIFTAKVITILVVFAAIAVGVTIAFIHSQNERDICLNNNTIINKDDEKLATIDYSLGLKNLNGKYKTNNIQIESIEYSEGEEFYTNYYSVFPLKIKYIKIDGLKNETIEENINTMIKEYAYELAEKYTAESIEINCRVSGNFSNILSLSFNVTTIKKNDENNWEYDYYSYGLNIDLRTGNRIELEECFVDGTSIKTIISQAAYTGIAWDEKYMWGTWDDENNVMIPKVDRSDLEDRVFRVLHEIQRGKYSYSISPTNIIIYMNINDDYWSDISIDIFDYHDRLAVFNRFLTEESLYTDEYNIEKEIYYGFNEYMGEQIHEPLENLFIQYNKEWLIVPQEYKTEVFEYLDARVKAEEEYARKNKDKSIFLFFNDELNFGWQDESDSYNFEIVRCELPSSYDEKFGYIENLRENELRIFSSITGCATLYFKPLAEKDKNIIFTDSSYGITYNDETYEIYTTDYNVIPDSGTRIIAQEELVDLTSDELNKAYNEIFARHGHDFSSKELKEYFFGFLWYTPEAGKTVSLDELSDIERQNLQTIKNEKARKDAM